MNNVKRFKTTHNALCVIYIAGINLRPLFTIHFVFCAKLVEITAATFEHNNDEEMYYDQLLIKCGN